MKIKTMPAPQYEKYINAIPLENYSVKDYGFMTIIPAEVVAGKPVEIRFIYHARAKGIKTNDGIKIRIPLKWSSAAWFLSKARDVKTTNRVKLISQPDHVRIKVQTINKVPRARLDIFNGRKGGCNKGRCDHNII